MGSSYSRPSGGIGEVQNRAFVTKNYTFEEGSMAGILEQLKLESLKKRRADNRLVLLYKGLKGKARIPTDDLIHQTLWHFRYHLLVY